MMQFRPPVVMQCTYRGSILKNCIKLEKQVYRMTTPVILCGLSLRQLVIDGWMVTNCQTSPVFYPWSLVRCWMGQQVTKYKESAVLSFSWHSWSV